MKRIITMLLTIMFVDLLSSGCTVSSAIPSWPVNTSSVVIPEVCLPDYRTTICHKIWRIEERDAVSSPLYWIRAIDCAAQLKPTEARSQAHQWLVNSWFRAFKQGVLMSNGKVTLLEKRSYLAALDSYKAHFPSVVRPLIKLWRSNQVAQLELSISRSHYTYLQQESDDHLDVLRQQQKKLHQQLSKMQDKLDRLTDIERQLSSRKASDGNDRSQSTVFLKSKEEQ